MFRKSFITFVAAIIVLMMNSWGLAAQNYFYHQVAYGDTFWKLSRKYNVSMHELMQLNNASENTILYPGQKLKIPANTRTTVPENLYIVQKGDSFWRISQKLGVDMKDLIKANGMDESTPLYPGQRLVIPREFEKPWITYITHTVQRGDDLWKLGLQYGIPMHEIMEANNIAQDTVLYPGQKLRIPVHHVPVKPTPGPQYGEYLDWWSEAQYLWPIGKTAVIQDFETGVVWNAKRTIGANHADVEPLTWEDAEIMKELWGGWSWEVRPVLVIVDGRKIAASASAMPHSVQYIKNNGFNGHFDVHFKNSTRHKDGKIDMLHQEGVKKAAGF